MIKTIKQFRKKFDFAISELTLDPYWSFGEMEAVICELFLQCNVISPKQREWCEEARVVAHVLDVWTMESPVARRLDEEDLDFLNFVAIPLLFEASKRSQSKIESSLPLVLPRRVSSHNLLSH
ncbi:hypothetical protein L0152_03390 [bacterium]|nr:hypothetical protein [bacterium]